MMPTKQLMNCRDVLPINPSLVKAEMQVDNYRAITISSTISKVFELCLLGLLDSHDLQLGFKKNKGCAMAIFGV